MCIRDRVQRIAHVDQVKGLYRGLDKLVIDALLDNDPGAGAADLALVEQDAQLEAVQGPIPVAVFKENIGALAAQLQGGGDELVGRSLGHIQAHFGGAGESQLPEAGMVQHILAGTAAAAGDHVQHAGGQQMTDELHQGQHCLLYTSRCV